MIEQLYTPHVTPWNPHQDIKVLFHSHFTDGETVAQRLEVALPRSHSEQTVGMALEHRGA